MVTACKDVCNIEVSFSVCHFLEQDHYIIPIIFCFPSPNRPIDLRKVKKKILNSTVKEASTFIYKHLILFINNNWYNVMFLSYVNINTTCLKAVLTFDSHVNEHLFMEKIRDNK